MGLIGATDLFKDGEAFLFTAGLNQETRGFRGEEQCDEEDGSREAADAEHPTPTSVDAPVKATGIGDTEVDDIGQEDTEDGEQLVGGAQGATVLGRSALGDVGDGQCGRQADADTSDNTSGNQSPWAVGEGRPQSREEEAGCTYEQHLAAANLIGKEAGEANANHTADHDGGDNQALKSRGQVVCLTEEFDGAGNAHRVVAIEKASHTSA